MAKNAWFSQRLHRKHADGSIRYLYVDFLADIPANKGAVLEFEKETDGKYEGKGVSVTQTGAGTVC